MFGAVLICSFLWAAASHEDPLYKRPVHNTHAQFCASDSDCPGSSLCCAPDVVAIEGLPSSSYVPSLPSAAVCYDPSMTTCAACVDAPNTTILCPVSAPACCRIAPSPSPSASFSERPPSSFETVCFDPSTTVCSVCATPRKPPTTLHPPSSRPEDVAREMQDASATLALSSSGARTRDAEPADTAAGPRRPLNHVCRRDQASCCRTSTGPRCFDGARHDAVCCPDLCSGGLAAYCEGENARCCGTCGVCATGLQECCGDVVCSELETCSHGHCVRRL
eukprot:TRINITY_DN12934_c0_g1_i1.p1 TRINITY_DN12934_c0_g1~~TRINITY_DN12934_c0_g1_i1.p1  ORF type:complete len:297 (-),score=10.31 TRINITY_DN12934_c0_g1_i1:268-1101(-)